MTSPGLTVDALGLACPVPIIRLAQAVRELAPGTRVTLLADDAAAVPDVAAWCRMTGHRLIASDPPTFVVEVAQDR